MVDRAKQNAEKARERILERLAIVDGEREALQKQLETVEAFLEAVEKFEGLGAGEEVPVVVPLKYQPVVARRPANPPREVVVAEVLRILAKAKAPIPRGQLFAALTEAGVTIHGKDPEVVFSTMLWRERGRIARLGKFGYWPANRPYKPANYQPPQ